MWATLDAALDAVDDPLDGARRVAGAERDLALESAAGEVAPRPPQEIPGAAQLDRLADHQFDLRADAERHAAKREPAPQRLHDHRPLQTRRQHRAQLLRRRGRG